MTRWICFLFGHEWTGCLHCQRTGNRQTLTYMCTRCHKIDRVSFLENER